MSDLSISDVRTFIPAKDFELSRAFYQALGWTETWQDEQIAVLENADHRFYLQNFYVKEWAENAMLHISVSSAQAWKQHVDTLVATGQFPGVRVSEPKHEPYGALVTYVWDPSGVLLHFAQWDIGQTGQQW